MNKNQGFTLIELLVVVLIIGILAAVALPQYRRAVLKSRAAEGVSLLHSIAKAEQVYFLVNEQYTKDLEALDLTLPKFHCGSSYCQFSSVGNDFLWEITFYDGWTRYRLYCAAFPNTEAEKICQSMGTYTHTGDLVYYMMEESN